MQLDCIIMMIHDCREELREHELKATSARLGVLRALENSEKPLDVGDLIGYLGQHKIKADKATVFRIINNLKDKGLVVPVQMGERKMMYEYSGKEEHHHLICQNCGSVQDISGCLVELMKNEILKKDFIVKTHSLEFFGICKQCQR